MVYGKLVMINTVLLFYSRHTVQCTVIISYRTSKKYPYIFISHIRTITRVSICPRTFVLGTRVLGLGIDLGPASDPGTRVKIYITRRYGYPGTVRVDETTTST